MRPSRVLRKIRNGGVAGCLKINSSSSDPRIVEVAAMTGINAIWLCTEHVPTNYGNLENQVRAARLHDVDAIVRGPRGSYSDYIRGFEMDVAGIMVPHVMDLGYNFINLGADVIAWAEYAAERVAVLSQFN